MTQSRLALLENRRCTTLPVIPSRSQQQVRFVFSFLVPRSQKQSEQWTQRLNFVGAGITVVAVVVGIGLIIALAFLRVCIRRRQSRAALQQSTFFKNSNNLNPTVPLAASSGPEYTQVPSQVDLHAPMHAPPSAPLPPVPPVPQQYLQQEQQQQSPFSSPPYYNQQQQQQLQQQYYDQSSYPYPLSSSPAPPSVSVEQQQYSGGNYYYPPAGGAAPSPSSPPPPQQAPSFPTPQAQAQSNQQHTPYPRDY
jgi:hypothetical protein